MPDVFEPCLLQGLPQVTAEQVFYTPAIVKSTFMSLLPALDARYEGWSRNESLAILACRYGQSFTADCIETGRLLLGDDGVFRLISREAFPTFLGFVLEAYVARHLNENAGLRNRALVWCSGRKQASLKYSDQYRAIGTGFITTSQTYPGFYNTSASLDLIFIRYMLKAKEYQPLTMIGSTNQAGIQIKAVTGNERAEVIDPLIAGRYSRVLTCLRHSERPFDTVHTFDVCMEIIAELRRQESIDQNTRVRLEQSIIGPASLGLDQYDIDQYARYAKACYDGRAVIDPVIERAIGMESMLCGSGGLRTVIGW